MATATKTRSRSRPRLSREQVATRLLEVLGDEPQAEAELSRALGLQSTTNKQDTGIVQDGLWVLAARQQAKRIPSPRTGKDGWTRWDSEHQAALAEPFEIEFPYEYDKHSVLAHWFVDEGYQRPLTNHWKQIERGFDPYLWQTPMVNDRGRNRLAIIDGQTRWTGATQLGVQTAPAQVFEGLTAEQEADIFWRVQVGRRGIVSYHRFRSQLRSGNPQAVAIQQVATQAGFELGDGQHQLKAVGALEWAYKRDPFLLERALSDLREAWPTIVPKAPHIKGLVFFFGHFPLEKRTKLEVDDERLVKRLRTTGPDGLERKMLAAREYKSKGGPERHMAMAIEASYVSGGKL